MSEEIVFNPLNGFDLIDKNFQGVFSTPPSSPADGWMYIDSTNNNLYVYYGTDWWNIGTLTSSGVVSGELLLSEDDDYLITEDLENLALEA